MAHRVYYNVEILFHPHRWFNDYLSLTNVFLAVIAWVALRGLLHEAVKGVVDGQGVSLAHVVHQVKLEQRLHV